MTLVSSINGSVVLLLGGFVVLTIGLVWNFSRFNPPRLATLRPNTLPLPNRRLQLAPQNRQFVPKSYKGF